MGLEKISKKLCCDPYGAVLDNVLIVKNDVPGAVKVFQCLHDC